MRKTLILALVLSIFYVPTVFAEQTVWTGNANVFLGGKFLDDDEWEPADDQLVLGVQLDARPQDWPVNLALDIRYGFGDGNFFGVEFESNILEFDLGVRKIFEQHPILRPFIGGGLSIVEAEFSGLGLSDDDVGIGFWIGGGFYLLLQEHFNIGLDLRFSTADVTLFGVDADAGGFQVGLLTGYHW